jgi:imidazolonepropionase-like amidohydrolase
LKKRKSVVGKGYANKREVLMAPNKANFKLIKAARLIDGSGGPPLERAAILIEGDKVRAGGTEESVAPPEGAQVEEFSYEDKTALPGLVDCHVHLIGIGDGRAGDELTTLPDEVLTLQAARNARAHLYSGVTTVRDCGAKHQTTFMLRRAMEMGITPGPRLVLSGRPVAIIGGHLSYFGVQATGPDECRAAVRQLIKEGADFIKITATGGSTRTSFPLRPSFTVDELRAICDEAHKFGKHAAAHCASSQGMVNALDAGIDTIIHGVFKEPDGSNRFRPEIAERIARQGVFVNATLHGSRNRVQMLEDKLESQGLTEQEQSELDRMRREYDARLECFAKMREVGIRMACGSDSAWGHYKMGGFQHEIEAHVEGGMSPMEAIVSATSDSARSCWIEDQVGTLAPGKQADILVVDGDPSKDVKALWKVVDVFKGGERVDREHFV